MKLLAASKEGCHLKFIYYDEGTKMRDTITMFTETQSQFTELKDAVLRELHQLKAKNVALNAQVNVLRQAVIRLQTEKDELTNIKTSTKSNPDMFYIGLLVVGFVVGMLGVVYNITM